VTETTRVDWPRVLEKLWGRWAPKGAPPLPPWQRRDDAEEFAELSRARRRHVVPVREPLVLISQIQRSGGTLLSQLFDGHPECHAHPGELYIGKPKKWEWPPLDLGPREMWFDMLFEPPVDLYMRKGYIKEKPHRKQFRPDVFPFIFSSRLQKSIFEHCVEKWEISGQRDILNCFMTSYFNAWLDNHNLYTGPKRIISAFTPRLAMEADRVERYFGAYPDGLLVSIARDPRAWYASAATHRKDYEDIEESLALWRGSTESALEAHARFGERVLIITYDQLVLETAATMGRIAERTGITMSPALLTPTFNGRPILANSTGRVERYGILPERTTAYRDALDGDTADRIATECGPLYERAVEAASP
jgi:Sulfotransferase family